MPDDSSSWDTLQSGIHLIPAFSYYCLGYNDHHRDGVRLLKHLNFRAPERFPAAVGGIKLRNHRLRLARRYAGLCSGVCSPRCPTRPELLINGEIAAARLLTLSRRSAQSTTTWPPCSRYRCLLLLRRRRRLWNLATRRVQPGPGRSRLPPRRTQAPSCPTRRTRTHSGSGSGSRSRWRARPGCRCTAGALAGT